MAPTSSSTHHTPLESSSSASSASISMLAAEHAPSFMSLGHLHDHPFTIFQTFSQTFHVTPSPGAPSHIPPTQLPLSIFTLLSTSAHPKTDSMAPRKAHYPPHTHPGLTTHLIRRGSLTITYPADSSPTKQTFGVGSRIDVDAGRLHEVWIGDDGTFKLQTYLALLCPCAQCRSI
jgi:hypothetical protein